MITRLAIDAVPESGQLVVDHDGRSVLVCRTALGFFAIENRCPHQGASLQGGRVRGAAIFCPLHSIRFDLRTGRPSGTLTACAVETFPLRVTGEYIEIYKQAVDDIASN